LETVVSEAFSLSAETVLDPYTPSLEDLAAKMAQRGGRGALPFAANTKRNIMPVQYCRHIRVNGERCAAPALLNQTFCYYHVELERRHRRCLRARNADPTILHPLTLQDGSQRDPVFAQPTPFSALDLPPLEDRHSIQIALSMIITALTEARIDPKLAALLFYGLQVASTNAHKLNPIPKRDPGKVSLTVLDEANGDLIAPEGDPEDPQETQDYERKGTAVRLWEKIQAEGKEEDRLKAEAAAKAIADALAAAIAELTATFNACNALTPADRLAAVSRVEAAAAASREKH
jgi:hypothetical protein